MSTAGRYAFANAVVVPPSVEGLAFAKEQMNLLKLRKVIFGN